MAVDRRWPGPVRYRPDSLTTTFNAIARPVLGGRVAAADGQLIVWRAVSDLVVFVSGEDDEIARKSRGRPRVQSSHVRSLGLAGSARPR